MPKKATTTDETVTEKLNCNCEDSKNHVQYMDANDEIVVECTQCGRFIKVLQPIEGIPHRDEKKK